MLRRFKRSADDADPAWGGLLWALPLAYVFVEPYRRQADWLEWTVTGLALGAFLALYTVGLIYWRRKEVLQIQCAAATVLAAAFMAYRPSGAIFFPVIAAFVPFSVNGRISASALLVTLVAGVFAVEWTLLGRPVDSFFSVIAFQSLILGAGTTFIARQTLANDRLARLAERERIACDLHDTLGQTLTAIVVKAELAGRLLEQRPSAARAEVADIERISRAALAEVRDVVHGYHGSRIEMEIVRAKSMLEAASVSVTERWDTASVPPTHERVLGLVLRESVTNIVRHAKATRCELTLQRVGDSIRLLVRDDGSGGAHREGLGIQSIKARVGALGGTAVWDGESGTAVTVTLPLPGGTNA